MIEMLLNVYNVQVQKCHITPEVKCAWDLPSFPSHFLISLFSIIFLELPITQTFLIPLKGSSYRSLRIQLFLLAPRRQGRFDLRNVCDSAREIPH